MQLTFSHRSIALFPHLLTRWIIMIFQGIEVCGPTLYI